MRRMNAMVFRALFAGGGLLAIIGSSAALSQTAVDAAMVRRMATAVELSGHDCEGMAGIFIGTGTSTRVYLVECRGGDRFFYIEDSATNEVIVTPCAAMKAAGYSC